jgi:DNA polymerase III delta prime subunit
MHNFPYSQNPKNWHQYEAQPGIKELCTGYIMRGSKALPRSLFISGPSGIGKTSLVRLLIRSFRCLNRDPDEFEPCGECAACLDNDERISDGTLNDVYWIQPGGFNDEDSLKSRVKQALAAAAKGQTRTEQPENDVLWVVFDEWQTFPINIRQEILIRAEVEVPGNNVCYIFVTMQEDRLGEEDRMALMRRSTMIRFTNFTKPVIKNFLLSRFPGLQLEVADMIANKSRGTIGMALAYYDNIRQRSETLEPLTASVLLGCATAEHRWTLWELLRQQTRFSELHNFLESLSAIIEPLEISRQLLRDILNSIENMPSEDQIYACMVLNQFQHNYRNADIVTHLLMLSEMSIVTKEAVYEAKADELEEPAA